MCFLQIIVNKLQSVNLILIYSNSIYFQGISVFKAYFITEIKHFQVCE